jgi:hypothetical protein
MKERGPSYGQNGQLVLWFTLAPFAYSKQILQALYSVEREAERGRKKSFSLLFHFYHTY